MSESVDIRVFNLPDVGEGLVEARVVEILVKEGDCVSRFDVVVEVETDKAQVELSAPWTGTIHQICCEPDTYVGVGDPLLKISVNETSPGRGPA
jgi:pyruvate dehydrogenase E2 component (dihydrolipoamide acetyltransferase)